MSAPKQLRKVWRALLWVHPLRPRTLQPVGVEAHERSVRLNGSEDGDLPVASILQASLDMLLGEVWFVNRIF